MKNRCKNSNTWNFERYGGRNITVCERWKTFANFLADMGEKPAGMSLDRINNSKGYKPGNCRWATLNQQSRNRRNNHQITYKGKTLTLGEWAALSGIDQSSLSYRLHHGWSIKDAMTKPFIGMRQLVTIGEQTKSLTDWRREMNIGAGTYHHRINRGWSVEDALTKPLRSAGEKRLIKIGSETKSVTAWRAHFGILDCTLYYRVKHGWPIERALTTPVKAYTRHTI